MQNIMHIDPKYARVRGHLSPVNIVQMIMNCTYVANIDVERYITPVDFVLVCPVQKDVF
jgi:hypothetical protein